MTKIRPTRKANPNGATSHTYKFDVACGKIKIVVIMENNEPVEVFPRNVNGGCEALQEAVGRLSTLLLESNIDLDCITEQLDKIICMACKTAKTKGKEVYLSCGKAVSDALKKSCETKEK